MKQIIIAITAILCAVNAMAYNEELDSVKTQILDEVVGRPYGLFDTSAFCSYSGFHPSQYLTDNNWDILCAFVQPGTVAKLDSFGIPYNKSQIRLLEVSDLFSCNNGVYSTSMNIYDKAKTDAIRNQSKEFADSIFPVIEPEIKQLIADFEKAGYLKQTLKANGVFDQNSFVELTNE